jgi:hypothetical protein
MNLKTPLGWGGGGETVLGCHLVPCAPQQIVFIFALFCLVVGDLGCFIHAKCMYVNGFCVSSKYVNQHYGCGLGSRKLWY